MPLAPRHGILRLAQRIGSGQLPLEVSAGLLRLRSVHIQATPAIDTAPLTVGESAGPDESPDASFEVLGAPYSLLSISLSPSQELYTRRGTLVGLHGDADGVESLENGSTKYHAYNEQTISTLRILEPLRRTLQGIPFLYQKIVSTSRISALVSTKSSLTSFAVLHLNGTTDWKIAQRTALVAWTGRTLSVKPTINFGLTRSQWGQSQATGRGLLALSGKGQIFSIELQPGERYVAHPSNIVAYSLSRTLPRPYRFKSSTLRFQIPKLDLNRLFPDSKFLHTMQETATWKFLTSSLFHLRTWTRRTIWGDRLFLQFEGPTTILLQSRGARLTDALSTHDINEIADAQAGVTQKAIEQAQLPQAPRQEDADSDPDSNPSTSQKRTISSPRPPKPPKLNVATIRRDGKVEIEPAKDAHEFSR